MSSSFRPGRIGFDVTDDGPGIDPDRRDAMLRRGRRLDESVPGHGFGLAIVGEIAGLYGGSLTLSNQAEGGLAAVISLPTSRQAA